MWGIVPVVLCPAQQTTTAITTYMQLKGAGLGDRKRLMQSHAKSMCRQQLFRWEAVAAANPQE